jgi:hypothetical protein
MSTFDPAGMMSSKMEEREVKNGRLAMIAFVGFCSQAAVQVCVLLLLFFWVCFEPIKHCMSSSSR